MTDDLKTIKFQMMLSPSEAERIDEWGFSNRIRSRAEAIRRLCQFGLFSQGTLDDVSSLLTSSVEWHETAKRIRTEVESIEDNDVNKDIRTFGADLSAIYGNVALHAAINLISDLQDRRDKLAKVASVEDAILEALKKEPDLQDYEKQFENFMAEWKSMHGDRPFRPKKN